MTKRAYLNEMPSVEELTFIHEHDETDPFYKLPLSVFIEMAQTPIKGTKNKFHFPEHIMNVAYLYKMIRVGQMKANDHAKRDALKREQFASFKIEKGSKDD